MVATAQSGTSDPLNIVESAAAVARFLAPVKTIEGLVALHPPLSSQIGRSSSMADVTWNPYGPRSRHSETLLFASIVTNSRAAKYQASAPSGCTPFALWLVDMMTRRRTKSSPPPSTGTPPPLWSSLSHQMKGNIG